MPTKRKILILSDINSIHTQKWVISLMNDFDIFLFSLDPILDYNQNIKSIEKEIQIETSYSKLSCSNNKLLFIKQYLRLFRIKKRFNPEIIHCHYATSYGLLGRLLFHNKTYLSVWGSDIFEFPKKSKLHRLIIRFILLGVKQIFSTSQIMALEINKYVNKNVEVIPFGVDTKLFVPIENINADFVIGTVKSLEDIYGIDRLIDVFYIVNKTLPNVICQIYGVGSKEHELKTKVLDLDLQDKVLFMGKITNNKVPAAISNFDIFCALSREESFGVAILEASSCGKPVIVSNIGGLPEVVIHNETGFIMDYNKENIAKKIIELYSDSDMINSLGKNGRAFVKNTFDWNSNVEKMKCYYAK